MATMSVREAAELLGVSASLVYQLCSDKRLSHFRVGKVGGRGKIVLNEKDVEAFAVASRVEAGEGNGPAPALRHIKPR